MKPAVSLQINLSPSDYQYVKYILPHQLKVLIHQVDEVILTIETKPSKGRFAVGWSENKNRLYDFLNNDIRTAFDVKISPVNYDQRLNAELADYFFGSLAIPDKDFRGGPFYAYFFGLHSTTYDLVLHLDADMFLGGGSPTWIAEATEFLKSDPDCLMVSPLPGPPHPEGHLIGQSYINKISTHTYELSGMSTRIFMTDKAKIRKYKLQLKGPGLLNTLKAIVLGNPISDLPEHLFKNLMDKQGLKRIDFLGQGNGIWSLHPPYRTKTFYDNLPAIITNIETGNLPDKQFGFYDIIDEVCDWTEAREKLKNNRWWKRF